MSFGNIFMMLLTGAIAAGSAWFLRQVPAWSFACWSGLAIGIIAGSAALCSLGLLAFDVTEAIQRRSPRAARRRVVRLIDRHLDTLARRRLSLVTVDHYGLEVTRAWDKELKHFVRKVLIPSLTEEEIAAVAPEDDFEETITELIERRVRSRAEELHGQLDFDPDMTPDEFEKWCAVQLARAGWKTRTTGASGDQGADVIAKKGGVRAVIQCKLYQSPVGNKAVQEAFAAQKHYSADVAAVVTNADFTPSARQLAGTTGVLLVLHSELDRFAEMLEAANRVGEARYEDAENGHPA